MNLPAAVPSRQVVGSVFLLTGVISVAFLVLIVFFMTFFVVRFRSTKHPSPEKTKPNVALMEIVWSLIPTVLVFVIFFYGYKGFKTLKSPPPGAMKVKVTASQWAWRFDYENGLTTQELTVPAGKPVLLTLTSKDVIHSFYVPAFRIKQDAVPGMENHLWFEPTAVGTYEVLCAEYCGTAHSAMLTKINVLEAGDFEEWYRKAAAEGKPPSGGGQAAGRSAGRTAQAARGERLYAERGCGGCHTTDGSPLVGPTLKGVFGRSVTVVTNGKERAVTADEGYIRRSLLEPGADIVKGYADIMPSEKDTMKEDDISAMIDYLKTLK
jgi:cytochrome c oxidase subunit 2